MRYKDFAQKLKLENKVTGIDRIPSCGDYRKCPEACSLAVLNRVMEGETVCLDVNNTSCKGSCTGLGLSDGIPQIPGGFGAFISHGSGDGFPPGERIKKDAKLAEEMLLKQPQDVMGGYSAIELKPYEEGDDPDLVTMLVTPDQLSTLIHLFNYECTDYDNVIMPMTSGCASVFRIPFGELKRGEKARGIVGNVDVFSRPHFPADSFFFTIPGKAFRHMLDIAGESVIASPIWKGVGKRL